MIGLNSQQISYERTTDFAREINAFSTRFETDIPAQMEPKVDWRVGSTSISVTTEKVQSFFSKINARKSTGPDGLKTNAVSS